MIRRVTAFIAALITAAVCQTVPASVNRPNHFHWSEMKAQELDYKHTIATSKELTTAERKSLLTFMLNRFRNPPNAHDESMFEGATDGQLRKLAADTRIELVDLNADGQKEIIAQGNGLGPCGGTGNCIVMVLQSTSTGWKTLLDTHAQFSGGFEKIRVLDTLTNSFRDIVVASHVSACEREALVLAYENKQYVERECHHINWCTAEGTARLKPEIGVCAK